MSRACYIRPLARRFAGPTGPNLPYHLRDAVHALLVLARRYHADDIPMLPAPAGRRFRRRPSPSSCCCATRGRGPHGEEEICLLLIVGFKSGAEARGERGGRIRDNRDNRRSQKDKRRQKKHLSGLKIQ